MSLQSEAFARERDESADLRRELERMRDAYESARRERNVLSVSLQTVEAKLRSAEQEARVLRRVAEVWYSEGAPPASPAMEQALSDLEDFDVSRLSAPPPIQSTDSSRDA